MSQIPGYGTFTTTSPLLPLPEADSNLNQKILSYAAALQNQELEMADSLRKDLKEVYKIEIPKDKTRYEDIISFVRWKLSPTEWIYKSVIEAAIKASPAIRSLIVPEDFYFPHLHSLLNFRPVFNTAPIAAAISKHFARAVNFIMALAHIAENRAWHLLDPGMHSGVLAFITRFLIEAAGTSIYLLALLPCAVAGLFIVVGSEFKNMVAEALESLQKLLTEVRSLDDKVFTKSEDRAVIQEAKDSLKGQQARIQALQMTQEELDRITNPFAPQ